MGDKKSENRSFAETVLKAEAQAIQGMIPLLGDAFDDAVEYLLECAGRVIVTGIGKAGIVGQKISATLASTGTPSHFLHPVEAMHGDLGRIVCSDVVIALSNSGETEVADLLEPIKRIGAGLIAMTGNKESTLAQHADIVLDIGKIEEACPLGLAPSASTTAMLALGDALALTVARRRKFNKEDYALFHPGGDLGRKLLKVEEVMRPREECRVAQPDTPVKDALDPKRAGAICIVDADDMLLGIFTDGDLRRRTLAEEPFLDHPISAVMHKNPKCIALGSLATEAAKIQSEFELDDLPVVDADGRLRGILDIQDLLKARVSSE